MMKCLAENKDALLVIAAYLAAFAAIFSSWMSAQSARKNRRATIREKILAEFRLAVVELLALADRAIPKAVQASNPDHPERKQDTLAFYKARNAIELLLSSEEVRDTEEMRKVVDALVNAYIQCTDELKAREKVINAAKKIIRLQLKKAGDGN